VGVGLARGVACGGNFDASNDPRIDQFFQHFPDAKNILELGSLEGGHTFRLAERARVLGLEGRQKNIDKALYMQKLNSSQNHIFLQIRRNEARWIKPAKHALSLSCLMQILRNPILSHPMNRSTAPRFLYDVSSNLVGLPFCGFF
jgi:hypothetical protein